MYYNYVHTPTPNPTLEQLAAKNDIAQLFVQASGKHSTHPLHAPLTHSEFSAALLTSLAQPGLASSAVVPGMARENRLYAAIVRQDTPKVHHFAVVWIVYAKKGA